MSSDKTPGSGPRDLTGPQLDETKAFGITGPESPARRSLKPLCEASLCAGGTEESTFSFCLSDSQSASSLPSDSSSPPQLPLSLLCASLTSLFLALSFHFEPFFSNTVTVSSCLHGSHFPLRSIRLHSRSYSHTLMRQKTGGGGGQTKRGLRRLAFSPNSCRSHCCPLPALLLCVLPSSQLIPLPTSMESLCIVNPPQTISRETRF